VAKRAAVSLMEHLPEGARIAVVNISSDNAETSLAVLEVVNLHLWSSKKFSIVERKELDRIRDEQKLQMSGDVSDETVVAIGHLVGANIVITGNITNVEQRKRLSLKALDVKTGQIVSMARENY
jgi:hypothetical protein